MPAAPQPKQLRARLFSATASQVQCRAETGSPRLQKRKPSTACRRGGATPASDRAKRSSATSISSKVRSRCEFESFGAACRQLQILVRCDDRDAATRDVVFNQRSNKRNRAFVQRGQHLIQQPELCVTDKQTRQSRSSSLP